MGRADRRAREVPPSCDCRGPAMTADAGLYVVDLAGWRSPAGRDRAAVARRIGEAGRRSGAFYVVNHGVPAALIVEHFAQARTFFALDLAEKQAIDVSRSNCYRGYMGFGTQTIDRATPGDLKEGFIMGPDLPPDHPHVRARLPNTGENLWPRRPAGLRAHMAAYVDAVNDLGRQLAAALAVSLGAPETTFAADLTEPLTYSQLLHYPPVAAAAETHRLGAGAHVDWGMLTILLQDDVGGLEIRAADGHWRAVPPVPGTFVVILGELMLRLSGARYRSAMHRVTRNTSGRDRYAMPTFFDPPYDYEVRCLPAGLTERGDSPYPACSVGEHMLEMARATLSAAL